MAHKVPTWCVGVSERCHDAGVSVPARTIERWSSSAYRLGPLDETPAGEQIEHYRTLAPLMGRGSAGADVAAFELARQGHPCERLRAVWRDIYCPAGAEAAAQADHIDPAGDAAFQQAERQATVEAALLERKGSPLRPLWRGFRRQVERVARARGEPADLLLHSLLTSGAVYMAGGELYTAGVVADVFGEDAGNAPGPEPEQLDAFVSLCRFSPDELARFLDTADLRALVDFIDKPLRPIEDEMLTALGISSDGHDWAGLIATTIAPPAAFVYSRFAPLLPPAIAASIERASTEVSGAKT